MRIVCLGLLAIALSGCSTKRNADRCCTDPVDCQARGLPADSTCASGEVCRGDECVLLSCTAASDCDLTAPYCESGACAETCSTDEQCPGFGQADAPFCVGGACAECRVDMDDCGGRICDANVCRACVSDGECPTGLCGGDGTCAASTDVAFVHPAGSGTSTCTQTEPCTLFRAVALTPTRTNIRFAAGIYQNTGTIEITGTRVLIGLSADEVSITNTGAGPVFAIAAAGNVTFDKMKIFGAKNGATPGVGISCAGDVIKVLNSSVTGNAADGLEGSCAAEVRNSSFVANGGLGIRIQHSAGVGSSIDRTLITANAGGGIRLQGRVTLRNGFVYRNTGDGIVVGGTFHGAPTIEFTTIAANSGSGVLCLSSGATNPTPQLVNTIVANHSTDVTFPEFCNGTNVLTTGADLRFVSPNAAPYDFHVLAGSAAIDAATGTTTTDFDGEARPKGAAADVGADEAF